MKQPEKVCPPESLAIDRQIDLLVDGELGENERRALLLRLDEEPNGWRQCALAFLEGQVWRESLSMPSTVSQERPAAGQARRRATGWRTAGRLAGLAAVLVLTFASGWVWHGKVGEAPPATQVVEKVESGQLETVATSIPGELGNSDVSSQVAEVDPLVNQWRKFGFEAETQTRMAALKLKDGRQVEVPIQQVMLRYVRGRTY